MDILKDKIANLTIEEVIEMMASCVAFLNALANMFPSLERSHKAIIGLALAFPILNLNTAMARFYEALESEVDLPKEKIELKPSKSQS